MINVGQAKRFRSARLVSLVSLLTLVSVGLVGCTSANPEAPREDALTAIEQALETGSGADFCVAINAVVPNTCVTSILDSSGLTGAQFRDFPISEESSRHVIEVSGFLLELQSTLFEFESGPEFVFNLANYQIPSVSTVFGGTLDGASLLPGKPYEVMPATAPGTLLANAPAHGFFTSSVSISPWVNAYSTNLTWSANAEELAIGQSEAECQAALANAGYDLFSRRSGFSLSYQSKFQRAATSLATFYLDGTNHEQDARFVNSPSELAFGECEVQRVVKNEESITIEWLAQASFDGTIGLQSERRSFFDDYTGEYQDRSFSTSVAGTSVIGFSQDFSELLVSVFDINAGMPMKSEKR